MDRAQEGSSRRAISHRRSLKHKDGEEGSTVAAPAPPRPAVRRWRIRGLTAAERAIQNRVNRPFDDPSSEIATPFDDPTPTGPDRWVQEEFEVETGRVVHQETIEGEPPDTESRALPLRDDLA